MLGSNVALTMINKILTPEVIQNGNYYIIGMIACLVASGLFVLLSTLTSMPVSSTHAIVGSLTGVVIAIEGWNAVNWKILGTIAIS
jgi:PiT family inorganic phosphate transporter